MKKLKMKNEELELANKWLHGTYMEDARVINCSVHAKYKEEIKSGKIRIMFKERKIDLIIKSDPPNTKDRVFSYLGGCYLIDEKNKKEEISGYDLRMISEGYPGILRSEPRLAISVGPMSPTTKCSAPSPRRPRLWRTRDLYTSCEKTSPS